MPKTSLTLKDRLLSKVSVQPNGCWHFTGCLSKGYGLIGIGGSGKTTGAHRASYLIHVGPIPPGMTIDHMCHTTENCAGGNSCMHRRCVNPDHLSTATAVENFQRGNGPKVTAAALRAIHEIRRTAPYCKRGHLLTPENIVPHAGFRKCKKCSLASNEEYRDRKWPSRTKKRLYAASRLFGCDVTSMKGIIGISDAPL